MSPVIAADFTAVDLAKEAGKFAAYSVKNGMRAAFLEFFAAQSWLLRKGMLPISGKAGVAEFVCELNRWQMGLEP